MSEAKNALRVLFVDVHNSTRSQMAEAYMNALGDGRFTAESAGIEPEKLNPYAVQVMKEAGYDISGNENHSVFNFYNEGRRYDFVIAVCGEEAAERCPLFPGKAERIHWPFPDLSTFEGEEEELLAYTRRLREQIKAAVRNFIARR